MIKDFFEITEKTYEKVNIKSNFHTHNFLCKHAVGTVSDYVKVAVENGLETIGISDHIKTPVNSNLPYMDYKKMLTDYLPQFIEAEKLYGNKIKILKGAEIEYFDNCDDYYGDLLKKLDYLILGEHSYLYRGKLTNSFLDKADDEMFDAYCKQVIKGIQSGYFHIVAHPDVIFFSNIELTQSKKNSLEDLVREAVKNNVMLELNANGIRCNHFAYPSDILIELCKKYNAKVVISADNHSPDLLCDEFTKRLYTYAEYEKMNICY